MVQEVQQPAHDSHTDTRAEVLKSLTQEQVFDYVTLCLLRHVCSWTFVIEEAEIILCFFQIFDELSTKDSFCYMNMKQELKL